MNTTTFIIFGVIAVVFALMSFVQTSLIKNQKMIIDSLKGENMHLKNKVSGLESELDKIMGRGVEDV